MADDYLTDDETAASTSTKSQTSNSDDDSTSAAAAPVGVGPLLEKEPEKVVKLMNGFWEDQESAMAEAIARWKANAKRREGVIGVHVVKPDPDKAEWKVWAPPGAARVPPTFNQPARLSRRLVSNMFVDQPLPEVTPGGASDNDKADAAEYQTRILQDVCTSPMFNVPEMAEDAVDKACTFDSGFVRVYIDPKGGGSRPRTIQASESALTVNDALYVDGDGETPQPGPYVTRYVKPLEEGEEEGFEQLTDDPQLADKEWLPGLRRELLTGMNLRAIPATATTIEEAQGVVIRTPAKLADLRTQYPDAFAELDNEQLWELVNQRPAKSDTVLTPADKVQPKKKDDDEPPPDDTTIIVTMVYMAGGGGQYPDGAYCVAAGTKLLLHRQRWVATVNGVEEALPVPIAQFKGWNEGKDTFYGYHLMHFLGPGQEVRAAALGGAIEHLDRFNKRKVFYSPQTLYQPKVAPAAGGLMVPVQPGTEPKTEDFPEYPRIGMEIMNMATAELNDESGLLPIAQGQTDPSVTSGLHAQKVIEQVNIGLGSIKRSTEKGVVRLWNISASFIRAYYTVSQQIRYRGDDQEYKQKDWSGVDLTDAKDVRILKGSFTMLAPSAKLSVAEYMRKLNLIDDNQLRMMAAGNMGGLMGLQDDPAMLRVRRQISLWEDGPPKAENPSEPMPDQYPGETAIEEPQNAEAPLPEIPENTGSAPMSDPSIIGSIPPAAPPLPDPMQLAGADVFKPLPNDEEPAIAGIRFRELSRAMCSKKFERQPEQWRAVFVAEYERMRKAAGVGTAAEAAASQQAAAQAQAQAEQQRVQAEAAAKAQAEQALAQLKSQEALALEKMKQDHELAMEKLRMEHEAAMKDAELQATEGEGVGAGEQAQADLEKRQIELAHEAETKAEQLRVEYEFKEKELAEKMKLEREKLATQTKTDLKKAAMAANPAEAADALAVEKKIELTRNADGKLTGARIIPMTDDKPREKEA